MHRGNVSGHVLNHISALDRLMDNSSKSKAIRIEVGSKDIDADGGSSMTPSRNLDRTHHRAVSLEESGVEDEGNGTDWSDEVMGQINDK